VAAVSGEAWVDRDEREGARGCEAAEQLEAAGGRGVRRGSRGVPAGGGGQADAARAEAARLLAEIKQVEHGEEARPLTPLIENSKKPAACPPGKR
jgi:hypothetical protein